MKIIEASPPLLPPGFVGQVEGGRAGTERTSLSPWFVPPVASSEASPSQASAPPDVEPLSLEGPTRVETDLAISAADPSTGEADQYLARTKHQELRAARLHRIAQHATRITDMAVLEATVQATSDPDIKRILADRQSAVFWENAGPTDEPLALQLERELNALLQNESTTPEQKERIRASLDQLRARRAAAQASPETNGKQGDPENTPSASDNQKTGDVTIATLERIAAGLRRGGLGQADPTQKRDLGRVHIDAVGVTEQELEDSGGDHLGAIFDKLARIS